MAVVMKESVESRRYTISVRDGQLEKKLTTIFFFYGSNNPGDAAVQALAPAQGSEFESTGMYAFEFSYEVYKVGADAARSMLKLAVTFGPKSRQPDKATTETEQSLEIGTETAHIEQAISQTNYPTGVTAFGKSIGVDKDGVKGVDKVVPAATVTFTRDRDDIDDAYFATVTALVAKVNNGTYKGYAAGTLLFMGMKATQRGTERFRCEYSFKFSPNVTQTIGAYNGTSTSTDQTVDKKGHDYMWFSMAKIDASGTIKQVINSIHVAKIFEDGDMTGLGI